ncbi:metallophosphoesterase [Methanocaldococcus indicus]|uniref:metallophosphoesterase n=1 Tax=Methanocaldococcus indicus TaxID=213231 RepID=UPI003C6CE051
MIIIGVTDLHGRFPSILYELKNKADVLVVSGDITHFGKGIEIIEDLAELSDYLDVLCVPGNCDTKEVIDELNSYNLNIDKKVKKIDKYNFLGIGGSNRTPFNTYYEYDDNELLNELKKFYNLDNIILVSHAPPYGTMADIVNNTHVGSKAVREFIENNDVVLCACGHIHESRCIDKIDNTIVVNPSPKSYFIYDTRKNIVILEDYAGL